MRLTLAFVAALLSAAPVSAQVQSPGDAGRIAGHVVTTYAEFVADATVILVGRDEQGIAESHRTTTDNTGAFSFTGLPEAQYTLTATKPGYTARQLPSLSEPGRTLTSFDVGPDVDLTRDGQVLDVQIVFRRAASISGRIIRPDGSAAPNVQVQAAIRAGGNQRQPIFELRTMSQFDGRYEFKDLPPGEYLVGATNITMPTRQGREADVTDDGRAARNAAVAAAANVHVSWYPGVTENEPGSAVTVLEGVNAEGIDIWLTPAQRFSVSGRVFWPVGVSIDDITIEYGDPAGTRSGMWLVSDPGGLFTLSGIAPGGLTLFVYAQTDHGPLLGIATTEVTVDSVEDVRVVIDRPGLIAGRVVYEGAVPASARATTITAQQKLLKVSPLYPEPESSIDPSGRFELRNTVGEYEFALDGLGSAISIKRVMRNGRALLANRLGVAPGETIRDLEIVVGR
jgi:hypothetical protein